MNWICLATLLLPLAIDAQSLSFVNLISMIIANGRFVQDNAFYPTSPSPSIDTDSTWNVNPTNCTRDFHQFSQGLASKELWALKSEYRVFLHSPTGTCVRFTFSPGRMGQTAQWIAARKSILDGFTLRVSASFTRPERQRDRTAISHANLYDRQWPFEQDSSGLRPVHAKELQCQRYRGLHQSSYVQRLREGHLSSRSSGTIHIPWINHAANLSTESVHCIETRSPDTTAVLTM